jgi:hypothetical protein
VLASTTVTCLRHRTRNRTIDLGLRAQAVNKLVLPLGEHLAGFVFADVFAVNGKKNPPTTVGFNVLAGAGLEWNDAWRTH